VIAVMVNEVLVVGALWVKIEARQTKNGNLLTHMQIETADILDDARVFRTYIPIVGFSKAADKL
jgi:single-stranded DNA-binding protein